MRINLQNIITSIMDKNVLEESFKEKVQAYSLRNPYVMNFVSRYENLIDWKDIKSAKKEGFNVNDSIQNQIKNILDKFIKDKLDPDSKTSIFSSKEDINWDRELQILKTEIANGNPEAQQALDSFKSDPDEAKDSVISSINSGKSAVINDWMQYMRGNKTYSKNYAFQYILFKSIFNTDGKTRNPPTPFNAAIIANIHAKIKDQPSASFNIQKNYTNFYSTYLESKNEIIKGEKGDWMKIPSKLEDPENFEENVRDLMTMSYKSWCIRQNSFAEDYLSKGAFWLYYVKDKSDNKYAELAIRLAGDSIQEIRGATQNQEIPEGYEGIIIDFLEKAKDIKGGEEYLKKYYRKRHDAEYKSYIKEHADELLKFYKKYMPYKYIADHDGEEDGSSKLYNWWRGDITKPLETNPNQLTLGFDIKEDTDFEEKDDKFKKNALVYGLIHNADLPNESKSLGYNYYIVEDDITLEDIGKKVDDELINAVVYSHDNGVEVEVYGIDYSMFITDIKAQDPKEFNQIEAMIDWCPDFDSTGEFFEQASGHLDDHAFYYGQRHGEEEVYLNALHNRLKTNISDCMEHFSVEAEGGYYADSDDISITIDHDGLINILLDEFEDISYQGELSWGEDWESMSSNVNYDGVDTYMALDAFWQEFNTDEYVEYAIEKFSEALLDPEVTHHLSILDSNDISYSGEDGIIYDGKLFAPVIKTEFDEFIKFIPLEQSIELTSEHLDLIFPYLDNQTLFYIYTDKEHGFFGFVESVESVDNPVVQGQS